MKLLLLKMDAENNVLLLKTIDQFIPTLKFYTTGNSIHANLSFKYKNIR